LFWRPLGFAVTSDPAAERTVVAIATARNMLGTRFEMSTERIQTDTPEIGLRCPPSGYSVLQK
jgi:hypothetical protein